MLICNKFSCIFEKVIIAKENFDLVNKPKFIVNLKNPSIMTNIQYVSGQKKSKKESKAVSQNESTQKINYLLKKLQKKTGKSAKEIYENTTFILF